MSLDVLSPVVREAWETVNNWCLGRRLGPLNIIKSALVRGAEAEKQLEADSASVINRGPRHPMQGLEGIKDGE